MILVKEGNSDINSNELLKKMSKQESQIKWISMSSKYTREFKINWGTIK